MRHPIDNSSRSSPLTEDSLLFDGPRTTYGRFRVLHQIGAGSVGPVFRGEDPDSRRAVAIKVLRVGLPPERVSIVATALGTARERLSLHPSLCAMLDCGVQEAEPYVVWDFVDGDSLDVALREYGPANITDALPRLTALADALDSAAAVGVLHGGLHLRDIIVSPEHTVLTGIGVASVLERVGVRPPVRRPYCAPEVADGRGVSAAGDQFALAAIAHEWLSGRRIAGAGAQGFHLPGVTAAGTEAVAAVFVRALDESPDERFPTATAFVDALADVSDALAPRAPTRRRRAERAPAPRLMFDATDDAADVSIVVPPPGDGGFAMTLGPADADDDVAPARGPEPDLMPSAPSRRGPAVHDDDPAGGLSLGFAATDHTVGDDPLDMLRPAAPVRHEPASRLAPAVELPEADEADEADETDDADGADAEVVPADDDDVVPADEVIDDTDDDVVPEDDDVVVHADEVVAEPDDHPMADAVAESPALAAERFARATPRALPVEGEVEVPMARSRTAVPPPPSADTDGDDSGGSVSGPMGWAVALIALTLVVLAGGWALVRWGTPSPAAPTQAEAPASPDTAAGEASATPSPSTSTPNGTPPATTPAAPAAAPEPSREAAPSRPTAAAPTAKAPPSAPRAAPAPGKAPPKSAPKAAAKAPARVAGQLLVRSAPSGAEVFVNGDRRGVTPLTLRDLTLGSYTVRVARSGYTATERRVTLDRGRPSRALDLRLARTAAAAASAAPAASRTAPATLVIDSRPAGARVIIDGRDAGRTPLTVSPIAPGDHAVRIDLAGYQSITTTARVEPGARARVAVSLTLERPQ